MFALEILYIKQLEKYHNILFFLNCYKSCFKILSVDLIDNFCRRLIFVVRKVSSENYVYIANRSAYFG